MIAVSVDNRDNTVCYPQKADFTFYGGLYRGVNLLRVPREHFALDYCGTPGIKVTAETDPETKTARTVVEVWTAGAPKTVTISVTGQADKVAAVTENYAKAIFEMEDVRLWDGFNNRICMRQKQLWKNGETVQARFGAVNLRSSAERLFAERVGVILAWCEPSSGHGGSGKCIDDRRPQKRYGELSGRSEQIRFVWLIISMRRNFTNCATRTDWSCGRRSRISRCT